MAAQDYQQHTMNVHLVDGTYELFRCFYGAPPAQGPCGREVGAVRGLVATLEALLQREGATHVAVAFDTVIESFRNGLFPGYKTGDGIDPVLHGQFDLAEQATRALGLVTWSMLDFEADDALATAAAVVAQDPRVERVYLCTPDKDLCQCVRGTRVVVLDRRRARTFDDAGVVEKLGVPPRLVPDFLALTGDTADGIPGLPGFGEKTAARVLQHFGGLERIALDAAQWPPGVRGADRLVATLAHQQQDAFLFRRLATLREDAPLPESDGRAPAAFVDALAVRSSPAERGDAVAPLLGRRAGAV